MNLFIIKKELVLFIEFVFGSYNENEVIQLVESEGKRDGLVTLEECKVWNRLRTEFENEHPCNNCYF